MSQTLRTGLTGPWLALALVSLGLLAILAAIFLSSRSVYAVDNPIIIENQQPGTDQWQLGRPGFHYINDPTGQIKGYASATSINRGETITFYVTVNPTQTYNVDLYRMGWYQGLGGRLLQHVGPLDGVHQPACPIDATTGLIDCDWSPSFQLTVPVTWTTGIYLAQLTNSQNYQDHIIFVLRDDSRVADLLYQQSVTTYQAYNNWPNDSANGIGKSLYDFNSYGANTIAGTPRAVKVSFNRPYASNNFASYGGAGAFLSWEVYFVHWLERMGYDVSYSTDVDTHANGARLLSYRGFLSVGHDEYWSMQMYNAAEAARDSGTNLGFFGADAVPWQVRFEPSASGIANRTMVCYKNATIDPVQGITTTVKFRDPPVNRPEQMLIGVQFTAQLQNNQNVAYVITNSTNWVYTGTGFHNGDAVPGMVGYEVDRYMSQYPAPSSISYTILSRSPVTNTAGQPDYANSSIYQAPSGAWVFGAGTISWSWALDRQGYVDTRIQQTTANILNNFLLTPTVTPTTTPTYSPSETPTSPPISPSSTPTNTPGAGILVGHVTWQGPPAQPNPSQQLPISLTLRLVSGGPESDYTGMTTDASGFFTVPVGGLAQGTYNWRVKGPKFLANAGTLLLGFGGEGLGLRHQAGGRMLTPNTLPLNPTDVEMGLMRTGDCNDDNIVTTADLAILKATFGKALGEPGYDDRADFTGDHIIRVNDFVLLKANFGQGGAPPIGPYRTGPAP